MRRGLAVGLAATALIATGCTLNRPEDPVVFKGSELPTLNDVNPDDIVAFRWTNSWDQVPVQVDERKSVDLGTVYNSAPDSVVVTAYADPDTFTGADPLTNFDANDELVFMAKDVGPKAPAGTPPPAGVVEGSGLEVRLRQTLYGTGNEAWIYLFERSGDLDPGAGESYVDYDFQLLSGDYKSTYKLEQGPNPEDTTVSTPYYETHFSDRWLNDELRVKAGGATEVDLIDRAKVHLTPGGCGRSEETFNHGEGAFIANKVGPVRAIRSYIGANSGPRTQRDHIFYERREDIRTYLRVHGLPGVLDFFDYSPDAIGMTYRNNNGQGVGFTIDGNPDSPPAGTLTWETVDGPQGGLSMVHRTLTDIPGFRISSYYFDDSTPATTGPETQCTGDSMALGASGPWVNGGPLPNTDPISTPTHKLTGRRTIYFEEPGAANGPMREEQAVTSIGSVVSEFPAE